ncbi:hypothetical protein [Psychromonas aquimarina]|uniref:hypothetical protein n=1 Tax=Psychromonas aquimarina TaxID=444919 RepID=UPI0004232542|nr:hypothetical protein [Psychromonas aquimarina]
MSVIGENIIKNHTINEKTGALKVEFFYKGKLCPSKEIKGPIINQYIGYYLILQDLKDVLTWLKKIDDFHPKEGVKETENNKEFDTFKYVLSPENWKNDGMLVKALYYSCLVVYGKCFTQAKGRKVKLERKNIEKRLQKQHDLIMEYRNTIVAHSGEGEWENGKLYVLPTPKELLKNEGMNIHIEPIVNRLDYEDDRNSDESFQFLVEHLIDSVEKKKKSLFEVILKDIIIPKGTEYWYS